MSIKTTLFAAMLVSMAEANAPSGNCPVLNLKTLPIASCATANSIFKSNPLSGMSYISTTPCPRGVDTRKTLQRIFKGNKDYPGREIQQTSGMIKCTYRLDQNWMNVLATNSPAIQLVATITSRAQVDYLNPAVCPTLTANDVQNLKQPGIVSISESTRAPGLKYEFSTTPIQSAGGMAGFKSMFRGDANLTPLKGQMHVDHPFAHTCEYQHKTGGAPVVLILNGRQDMK